MRKSIFPLPAGRFAALAAVAALAAGLAATAGPQPAAAAWNLPWCAHYYNDVTSCAYTSYEQCFATIGGPVGGFCTRNPAIADRPPVVERPHRRKHHASGY